MSFPRLSLDSQNRRARPPGRNLQLLVALKGRWGRSRVGRRRLHWEFWRHRPARPSLCKPERRLDALKEDAFSRPKETHAGACTMSGSSGSRRFTSPFSRRPLWWIAASTVWQPRRSTIPGFATASDWLRNVRRSLTTSAALAQNLAFAERD